MTSLRIPRRRSSAPVDSTIPLINIAFLLMAFFMLIGRMDATAPFQVLPPESAAGTALPQGGATVSVSAEGNLALDGVPAEAAEVLDSLSEGSPALVRINAHAYAELAHVLPLATAIEGLGVPRIVLVVTPPQSSP